MTNWHAIEQQAIKEIEQDEFRKAVEKAKEKIRKDKEKTLEVKNFTFKMFGNEFIFSWKRRKKYV